MSSRRDFIGGGVAATAVSLVASAPVRANGGSWGGSMRIGVFVYESGQPLAIEAARVAAGQAVPVRAFDAASAADFGGEIAELVAGETRAIAGLTSNDGFRLVSDLAARRGWTIRHSVPAGRAGLLHWIVGPAGAHIPR